MRPHIYNIYRIALAFITALTFQACDDISPDDRYIAVDKPVLPAAAVPKTLLIQEFTGNDCRNCPAGSTAIHNIMEANPGRVIAVGMHPEGGGNFTQPLGTQNFRCRQAQVMYEYYKPSGFPCAVFNGTQKSTNSDDWNTYAIACLAQEAYMTIDAQSAYDVATRLLKVDYAVTMTADSDAALSIMLWIMENGITGIQNNEGKYIFDYVHNHVLRASLNGDWGTPLGAGLKNGDIMEGSATITLEPSWVAENCQVVAYVYRNDNKAVEQATAIDVVAITQ